MLVKIGIGLLVATTGLFSAVTLALFLGGIATVSVETSEVDLWVPVPLAVVDVAMIFVPLEEMEDLQREFGPHREVILAALSQLGKHGDFTLVDVQDRTKSVVVRIDSGNLVVDVDDPESKVDVSIPLRGARRILASIAPGRQPDY